VQGSAPADAAVEVAWREGEGFVWDDSVCHEVVWRGGGGGGGGGGAVAATAFESGAAFARSEPRIVLLLLLLHPAMTRMPICPALDAS